MEVDYLKSDKICIKTAKMKAPKKDYPTGMDVKGEMAHFVYGFAALQQRWPLRRPNEPRRKGLGGGTGKA